MRLRLVINKRAEGESGGSIVAAHALGVALALMTVIGFLILTGKDLPSIGRILDAMIIRSFFRPFGIVETINKSIPLIVTGLAVSLSFRMKLWNIGGEGQIILGATAAAGVAMLFSGLPSFPLLLAMAACAFLAGAIWALLAALPRAFFDVNETIVTLMLNYIASVIVTYLVYGPWRDPDALGFPMAPPLPRQAWFPYLFGTPVQAGLLLGIVFCVVYGTVLKRSKWGFDIRVIGESPASAVYAGMNVRKNILLVLAISGGLAGLAGFSELAGNTHRLEVGLSSGYGYTAIIIAWLARMRPAGIIFMGVFMAALLVGGTAVRTEGVPAAVALMIQGCILLFVLGCDCLSRYSFRLDRLERVE